VASAASARNARAAKAQVHAQAQPVVDVLVNRDQRLHTLRLRPDAQATRLPTLQWTLDEARAKADAACAERRRAWWSASA
jgi:pyruvate-formate lyase-activating enzyme